MKITLGFSPAAKRLKYMVMSCLLRLGPLPVWGGKKKKKKKEVTSSQLPTNKAWLKLVWGRQGKKKKNQRILTGELGVSGHRFTAAVRQEIERYSQVSLCTALHNTVSEKCGVVPLFCACALSPYPLNSILPAWLDTDKVYKNTRCTLLWAALT